GPAVTLEPPRDSQPLAAGPIPAELQDVSGVAPIGLFSSSPPNERRAAGAPPPSDHRHLPRPTPIALFSVPPPPPEPSAPSAPAAPPAPVELPRRAPRDVLASPTAPPEPIAAPALELNDRESGVPEARDPALRRQPRGWLWWGLPLAAAACVVAFFSVHRLTAPVAATVPVPASAASENPALSKPTPPAYRAPEPVVAPAGVPLPSPPPPSDEREPSAAPGTRVRDRGTTHHARGATQRAQAEDPGPRLSERDASARAETLPPDPSSAASAASVPDAARPKQLPEPLEHMALDTELGERAAPTSTPTPARKAAPLFVKASVSAVETRGSLPTSPVRHAVERLQPQFNACYERAVQLAGHHGFGELIVEVRIDERGRASAPHVRGGRLAGLDACVSEAVSKLICSKAPDTGTVNASWKITFGP
ncbi:MAG: hypothetical protein ABW321_02925, partial [Polyangiales bacterium]